MPTEYLTWEKQSLAVVVSLIDCGCLAKLVRANVFFWGGRGGRVSVCGLTVV